MKMKTNTFDQAFDDGECVNSVLDLAHAQRLEASTR